MKILHLKYDKDVIPYDFTGKILWDLGRITYHLNGKFHREDGPAIILLTDFGDVFSGYCLNGLKYDKEEWFEMLSSEQKVKAMMNLENFDVYLDYWGNYKSQEK